MWDLLGPGFESTSPALASGFLAIGPPGKFPPHFFSIPWSPASVSRPTQSPTQTPGPTLLTPGPSLFLPRSPLIPHQDPHLDKFFTLVHVLEEGAFPFRLKDAVLSEGTVEQELRGSLAALRLASPEPLVAFSHHVLDKLVRLVVRPPVIGGQFVELSQPQTLVAPSREWAQCLVVISHSPFISLVSTFQSEKWPLSPLVP